MLHKYAALHVCASRLLGLCGEPVATETAVDRGKGVRSAERTPLSELVRLLNSEWHYQLTLTVD
jgi:hypothetical protein